MSEHYLQPEVHIVITQVPGVDGISSPARLTQIEADLATVLGRPNIASLDDVPDVDVGSASDGDALVYHAATDEWTAGMVQSGIYRVFDWANELTGPFSSLQTVQPLTATVHPTMDGARIGINVGTSADTVAAGNHTHELPDIYRVPFSPTDYLSGGSRPLASSTPMLQEDSHYNVTAKLRVQIRGADAGAAYFQVSLGINGDTRTSPGGSSGFWAVQGVPREVEWEHDIRITGSGSSIPVTATIHYHSGAGLNVDFGELSVVRHKSR